MASNQAEPIRVELTPEQKEMIRTLTGQDVDALEFSVQELEQRIAPGRLIN
jgi:hypothetical protein